LTIAIYPGAFDPITNGHLDIAARAAKLFDKVIIGVFDTPDKRISFSTEERVELVEQSIGGLSNVSVTSYKGLTVDFAKEVGAKAIVRGLRIVTDFEREFNMSIMNKKLAPDIELICLMANLQYQFLSSSLLKEVAELGGDIDSLVPKHVAVALMKNFKNNK
jgi:pantetheine-phosphate adenylyltransferase